MNTFYMEILSQVIAGLVLAAIVWLVTLISQRFRTFITGNWPSLLLFCLLLTAWSLYFSFSIAGVNNRLDSLSSLVNTAVAVEIPDAPAVTPNSAVSTPTLPVATIDSPTLDEAVPRLIRVTGKYANLNDSVTLWVYVLAGDGKYYLSEVVNRYDNGTWEINDVTIGTPDAAGQRFQMGLVLTRPDATAIIRQQTYSLPNLPSSGVIGKYNEITIYRQ